MSKIRFFIKLFKVPHKYLFLQIVSLLVNILQQNWVFTEIQQKRTLKPPCASPKKNQKCYYFSLFLHWKKGYLKQWHKISTLMLNLKRERLKWYVRRSFKKSCMTRDKRLSASCHMREKREIKSISSFLMKFYSRVHVLRLSTVLDPIEGVSG